MDAVDRAQNARPTSAHTHYRGSLTACLNIEGTEPQRLSFMNDGQHVTLTRKIVGCGIEVHKHLGPGLLESVYESALCIELDARGLPFKRQLGVPLFYKGHLLSEHRPDLIVDNAAVLEIKSVTRIDPIHVAQMLTYLRVTKLRVGLVLNFNSVVLKDGIQRVAR